MDSATEDIYLQKLEEFVYDEEKIVSCRWLSINLNIDIRDSKHLLEKYMSDVKDTKRKDVRVTYLLSGTVADGSLHITIAKENEIEQKKAMFQHIVDQQIYSIQKCKEIDLNLLSMVDYLDIHNSIEKPVCGSITSKQCIHRVLKTKKVAPVSQKSVISAKPSSAVSVSPKTSINNTVKVSSTKSKHINGITSFFNKAATQVSVKTTSEKTETKSETPTTIPNKDSTQKHVHKLIDSDSDSEQPIQPVVSSQTVQNGNESQKTKTKPSSKRSKKNNNKAPSPKRRKRIIQQESDSDDMFGSDTKDDVNDALNNDSEEEVPKPKLNVPLAPKNKKRKQVDRTYENEEGYIVTTKEWIEESPSEDEIIPETPQKIDKALELKVQIKSNDKDKKISKSENNDISDVASKDTKTLNVKGKGGKKGKKALAANQPTLMSFFKRA